ncbi:squidulin-like isoform X2 [Ptychodera flava]|uniref:squidulin-like isoform X2 n=1 Tax=Ptychodera flava TaxID=63121 RepID=UPI00396A3E0D
MGCGSSSKSKVVVDKTSPEFIIAAFSQFDKDGDGFITLEELKQAFTKMKIEYNDVTIYQFMREIDTDGDGVINIREFAHWWLKQHQRPQPSPGERMIAIFRAIDEDGKGYITPADLKVFFLKSSGSYTDREIATVMEAADVNGDGKIDFGEFVRLMLLIGR